MVTLAPSLFPHLFNGANIGLFGSQLSFIRINNSGEATGAGAVLGQEQYVAVHSAYCKLEQGYSRGAAGGL